MLSKTELVGLSCLESLGMEQLSELLLSISDEVMKFYFENLYTLTP